jgi:23S rRNA pseudouridine1911/1915/1917 synthase
MITEDRVLFEDNHLIAVNKNAGDISQGDKTGDIALTDLVADYLKKKYEKPGNVFCGLIHRIDRPVSGVSLFAKTSKALERMNKIFHDREIQKTYWAVVKNIPPENSMKLVHFMTRNRQNNKSTAHSTEKKDSKKAELSFEVLCSSDNFHLLEILPITGRHHQIRAQLQTIGCSIKGDLKYGFARSNEDASIHLHARKLSFIHPVSNEQIEITAPVPNDKLWKYFENEIKKNNIHY